MTFEDHLLTFEDHPLTAGSITLDEMEEVVGILYNLDGCEKVLIITTINVNIAITIITSSFLPFTFCPRLQKGSYLSTKKTTALGQNPNIVLYKHKMETAERAETLFHELDANPDGGITEEEFIRF